MTLSSLVEGKADIIVTSLTVTPGRSKVVSFLPAIGTESYALFTNRITEEKFFWNSYIDPFTFELWMTSAASLVLVCLFGNLYIDLKSGRSPSLRIINIFPFAWQMLCYTIGKHPLKMPKDNHSVMRTILLGFFITGNFLYMSYNASLTAILANRVKALPFSNPLGLLNSDHR